MGPNEMGSVFDHNDVMMTEHEATDNTKFLDSVSMAINNADNSRRIETAYGRRRMSNIWGDKEFNYQRMLLRSQGTQKRSYINTNFRNEQRKKSSVKSPKVTDKFK